VYLSRDKFAEAVLFDGDKITAVGDSSVLLSSAPASTAKIDAGGALVLPGFHDCHEHLAMAGREAQSVNADVTSVEALIAAARQTIERNRIPECAYVRGGGWDDEKLGRYPTRHDLDKISTRHPILLSRRCFHVLAANTLALERAGIDPAGHDGILRENDARPVWASIPEDTEEQTRDYLAHSLKKLLKNGVTAVASNDVSDGNVAKIARLYSQLFEDKKLRVRVSAQVGVNGDSRALDALIAAGYRTGSALIDGFLKVGPLKLFADGSLGSRTALLREPYNDAPETRGVRVLEPGVIAALVKTAAANGFQVATHAIGSAGIETVLDAYEAVIQNGKNPLRHGILHCQITDAAILARFAASDILALIQPIFLESDRHVVRSRVGDALASTSYAWATMERLGIKTAYGTDCPVEQPDPIRNLFAAVTRFGYDENERVDVATAVDAYTRGTAYANFDENRLGRIAPGYLADFALLDTDIFSVAPEEIEHAKVIKTIVGGEVVYEA
jgi:predicted amidohydrolase YtcJ